MDTYSGNSWVSTTTSTAGWDYAITAGTAIISGDSSTLAIGVNSEAPINPFNERNMDYRIGRDRYSYVEDDNSIKVDKGSPAKARYAVFYAVNKDPVIFCRTRREMIKEVKKLLKRKEVDYKSIRIFALVGGAKKAVHQTKK